MTGAQLWLLGTSKEVRVNRKTLLDLLTNLYKNPPPPCPRAKVGKVNLKSNSDETLRDESLKKLMLMKL
jgi:hypothetical protein